MVLSLYASGQLGIRMQLSVLKMGRVVSSFQSTKLIIKTDHVLFLGVGIGATISS